MMRWLGIVVLAVITIAGPVARGQSLLFEENFDYKSGSLLANNNWVPHSGVGFNRPVVSFTNLSYPGYPSTSGYSTVLQGAGEDLHRLFDLQTYGPLYVSFLVKVSMSDVYPTYFLHLSRNPFNPDVFQGKVFVKSTGSGTIDFGVSKLSDTATFTGNAYAIDTTYLLVLKYRQYAGPRNDVVTLFVFSAPALPPSEPSPSAVAWDNTAEDIGNTGSICLRQGGINNQPAIEIDGIRIGTSWSVSPLPIVFETVHGHVDGTTAHLAWTAKDETRGGVYRVERSVDGASWTARVSFVADGSGSHAFEDDLHGTFASEIRYRIRYTDVDGTETMSQVIVLPTNGAAGAVPSVSAAPNPVRDRVVFSIAVGETREVSLDLFDALGRLVAHVLPRTTFSRGTHTVEYSVPPAIPPGAYYPVLHVGTRVLAASPLVRLP
jgi:hypothetical protein